MIVGDPEQGEAAEVAGSTAIFASGHSLWSLLVK